MGALVVGNAAGALLFSLRLWGETKGSVWCFVTRVESVVTRVREKCRLYS